MSGLNQIIPIAPGTLLSSASAELDRQMQALVPPGKKGAALTIIDATGARVAIAYTYGGESVVKVTASLEVQKKWDKTPPEFAFKLKAVF